MNLVLSQVEESIHHVDVTEDGQALPTRVSISIIRHSEASLTIQIEKRSVEMLFVRGDGVILVSRADHTELTADIARSTMRSVTSFNEQTKPHDEACNFVSPSSTRLGSCRIHLSINSSRFTCVQRFKGNMATGVSTASQIFELASCFTRSLLRLSLQYTRPTTRLLHSLILLFSA